MKHIEEPIRVERQSICGLNTFSVSSENTVGLKGFEAINTAIATAERLEHCYNACAGIDNLNIVKEAGAMYEKLKYFMEVSLTPEEYDTLMKDFKAIINRIEATE
jgi:hypothetical protein